MSAVTRLHSECIQAHVNLVVIGSPNESRLALGVERSLRGSDSCGGSFSSVLWLPATYTTMFLLPGTDDDEDCHQ